MVTQGLVPSPALNPCPLDFEAPRRASALSLCRHQEVRIVTQERPALRNLYLYLVCLVTLVISLFAAVNLVRSAVELLYPDPGYYISEPAYGKPGDPSTGPSAAERRRQERANRDTQRHQTTLGLVSAGTTLLIAAPLYRYHWRRVERELPARSAAPTSGSPPPE